MSNNKQSSVEWFIEQLEEKGGAWENVSIRKLNISIDVSEYMELKTKAKAMHKDDIIESFDDGEYNYFYSRKTGNDFEDGKEYYEEIFGGNND